MSDKARCGNCKYWQESDSSPLRGRCAIVLPPWVAVDDQEFFTSGYDRCDLHAPVLDSPLTVDARTP